MKRSLIVLFSLFFVTAFAAQNNSGRNDVNGSRNGPTQITKNGLQWYTDYQQATAIAKRDNKPIILFFTGSDWCGWCKKMEKDIFSSPDFIASTRDKFVFVEIDFPMNHTLPSQLAEQNEMLKKKFNVTGYPTVIILDSNQNFLAESEFPSGGARAYAEYLGQFVRK